MADAGWNIAGKQYVSAVSAGAKWQYFSSPTITLLLFPTKGHPNSPGYIYTGTYIAPAVAVAYTRNNMYSAIKVEEGAKRSVCKAYRAELKTYAGG